MGTVITKPQLEGNKDCDCVLEVLNEQLAEERSKQARQHKDMHGANWHTVSDEDISLPGPSSPAPAVPPQVMHTPKTIERQGPESSHAAPDLRWTKHTVQEAQRAACVKAAHPDKPRAGSWIELWRQAFQGSEEPTCYAAECTAAGKSGSHLWLVSSDQGQFNHEHCYIAPLCNTHSKSNRFKHPAGDFMLKSNVTLIRIVPHPTQVPGSRTCALDDSAAVSKIAVAGKVTEAPMKNLSIKPVAGRLVTASRPSIRPEIPDDPPSPQSPVCPVLLLPYAARPATIRTEVKSWTHKHTDLGCEVYPLRRTSQVTGVRGTTSDKSNWKKTFEAVCGASASLLCFAKGCPLFSRVGGHLWLYDAAEQRYDFEHCYIAPLCKRHNAREFDYPHPFLLKRDVTVMRIVPHTCYLDYGPLPSRRAAA